MEIQIETAGVANNYSGMKDDSQINDKVQDNSEVALYAHKEDFKPEDLFTISKTDKDKTVDENKKEKDNTALALEKNSDNNSRYVKFLDMFLKFDFVESVNKEGDVNKKMVISVIDEESGEVIRTVPPEELKKDYKSFSDFIGLLLDKSI